MEDKWQEIMKRYLALSDMGVHTEAPMSGHYIHLTDYPLVKKTVYEMTSVSHNEA